MYLGGVEDGHCAPRRGCCLCFGQRRAVLLRLVVYFCRGLTHGDVGDDLCTPVVGISFLAADGLGPVVWCWLFCFLCSAGPRVFRDDFRTLRSQTETGTGPIMFVLGCFALLGGFVHRAGVRDEFDAFCVVGFFDRSCIATSDLGLFVFFIVFNSIRGSGAEGVVKHVFHHVPSDYFFALVRGKAGPVRSVS